MVGGDTAWSAIALRAAKDIIEYEVDSNSILDTVSSMQLARWKYKRAIEDGSEDNRAEHISPFADDFRVFGLGSDPDKLSTIDLEGVLYACVKGLNSKIEILDRKNISLEKEVKELRTLVDVLRPFE